jgi:serine/threonine protein kinase
MPIDAEQQENAAGACRSERELRDYCVGALSSEEIEAVAVHLERCGGCLARAQALPEQRDPLIAAIRFRCSASDELSSADLELIRSAARQLVADDPQSSPTSFTSGGGGLSPKLPLRLGQYLVQERLGQGGMGTVYKALHVQLGRTVAIKMISGVRTFESGAHARFRREIQALGRLDHPNIVRATDAGECDGQPFLVMDHVEGIDLSSLVRRVGPLSIAAACELVRQTALGLEYISRSGFVHRDIKPSNLMLTPQGQIKILDLGLALIRRPEGNAEALSTSSHILGTVDYISPEQVQAPRSVDIRSDVYSLGCTLYKLLAGRAPFEDQQHGTPHRKMVAHCTEPAPPIQRLRPEVPDDLSIVVGRMLAKSQADRFDSPAKVAEALTPWAEADASARLWSTLNADESSTASFVCAGVETDRPVDTVNSAAIRPTRRRRANYAVVGLSLSAAVLAIVSWGAWSVLSHVVGPSRGPAQGGSESADQVSADVIPPAPAPFFEDLAPEEIKPAKSYRLLNRRPTILLWPEDGGLSSFDFDEDLQSLTVHCRGAGALAMGRMTICNYVFQTDVFQNGWTGGTGVFFGAREVPCAQGGCWRMQLIHLAPSLEPNRAEFPYFLQRSVVTVTRTPSGGAFFSPQGIAATAIKPIEPRQQMLELTVGDSGLQKVRWGGQELPSLCDTRANGGFKSGDYIGYFGALNYGSDAVFRNASVMVKQQPPPLPQAENAAGCE